MWSIRAGLAPPWGRGKAPHLSDFFALFLQSSRIQSLQPDFRQSTELEGSGVLGVHERLPIVRAVPPPPMCEGQGEG